MQSGQTAQSAAEVSPNYPNAYYGGVIKLDADTLTTNSNDSSLRHAFPAESTIAITLTPQGTLVDGSIGQKMTQTVKLSAAGGYNFYLRNIPIGIYSAAATVTTPAGQSKPLHCKVFKQRTDLSDSTWERTVTIGFPAKEGHANGGGGGTEFAKLYLAPSNGEDDAVATAPLNTETATTEPQMQTVDVSVPPNIAEPGEADAEIEGKWATPDFSEVTPHYTIVKWDYDVIGKRIYITLKPKSASRPRNYDLKYLDADGVEVYSQNVSLSSSSTDVGQSEDFSAFLHWGDNVKSIRLAKRD